MQLSNEGAIEKQRQHAYQRIRPQGSWREVIREQHMHVRGSVEAEFLQCHGGSMCGPIQARARQQAGTDQRQRPTPADRCAIEPDRMLKCAAAWIGRYGHSNASRKCNLQRRSNEVVGMTTCSWS